MTLKLLNLKYSPNVGDGLLVECLEAHLAGTIGTSELTSIDLAGRTDYATHDSRREILMRVLGAMPSVARRQVARAGLSLKLAMGLRRHYRESLDGASSLVLGGGNLFSDQDLYFPMKLTAVLHEAARQRCDMAVFGCGVAARWSAAGRRMLCGALAERPPVLVAVRDAAAKSAWDMAFASAAGREATVVHDSGLLASTVHRVEPSARLRARPLAAIGVMSAVAIRYHGFEVPSTDTLARWYLLLAETLLADGLDIRLFTNGSPEDRRFAQHLWAALADHPARARLGLSPVRRPVDLCQAVGNADLVIAFRMHALIAAYSYGAPIMALKWDPKVDAFLRSVGLEAVLVDVARTNAVSAARFAVQLWRQGSDAARRLATLSDARRDIEHLARALGVTKTPLN